MKFIKKLWVDLWESGYDLYNGEDGYYLAVNDETRFHNFSKYHFKEKDGMLVCKLAPYNEEESVGEMFDIIEHKCVLCYLFKEGNRYTLKPAAPGDEEDLKEARKRINTEGKELDFRRVICHKCKMKYYFKDGPYKIGFKYMVKCPKCKHVQEKVRKELSYDA